MKERVKIVDMADGRRTDLPGGSFVCELISGPLAGSGGVCMGFSTWKPGTSTKQMVHEVEELAFIVAGEGKLAVGDERLPYRAGQGLLIPAGVPHGVVNDSEDDMSMVYIFAHSEYPPTRDASPDDMRPISDERE